MGKRFQVVVEDAELRRYQRIARREGLSLGEWVRQTLRAAIRKQLARGAEAKRLALQTAMSHGFPAPDIDQMLEEIERGYAGRSR